MAQPRRGHQYGQEDALSREPAMKIDRKTCAGSYLGFTAIDQLSSSS
jgi:hypothetical protein